MVKLIDHVLLNYQVFSISSASQTCYQVVRQGKFFMVKYIDLFLRNQSFLISSLSQACYQVFRQGKCFFG
jgi:hypothetical protein